MVGRKGTAETLPHRRFLEHLLALGDGRTALRFKLLSSARDFLEARVGGVSFRYVVGRYASRVELYVARGSAAARAGLLDKLKAHKDEVEVAFGGPLSWESCRVALRTQGGVKDDEAKWRAVQDSLVNTMAAMERALLPLIDKS